MKDLLLLFFGWLSGIASPIIVDSLKRKREERDFRESLKAELEELQYRLAMVAFMIFSRHRKVDRAKLTWLRPIVANYEGVNRSEQFLGLVDAALKETDEQILAGADILKPKEGRALGLRKYAAPLLQSRISSLSCFDQDSQRRLLEINMYLSLFSEEVDQSRYYFQLTFAPGTSETNYDRAVAGVHEAQLNAAERAESIVDHISKIRW